jgi:tRNA(Ile)-lysidine synthase
MADRRPPRAAVRAAVRECLADLEPGQRVVIALSGGADSLALTAASVAVGADLGLLCEAVVIDHQIQPGSGEVAARAAEQARILGCSDARVIAVDVPRGAGSGGLEAAARGARYAALDALAGVGALIMAPSAGHGRSPRGTGGTVAGEPSDERLAVPPAAAILLGHTREDQAETVLLGLARGSGTRSLAGMAARTGIYRRPLLDLPRDVVVAAALEVAAADPRLEPWSDPHNTDVGFARVRVRHEVLPVLEDALGRGIVDALARTAELAREDADALDAWAERVWAHALERATAGRDTGAPPDTPATRLPVAPAPPAGAGSPDLGRLLSQEEQEPSKLTERSPGAAGPTGQTQPGQPGPTVLPIAALTTVGEPLPAAIVRRVVRRLLIEAGCPIGSLTAGHIRATAALLEPGASGRTEVALPGGRRARREADALVVRV